MSSRFHFFKRFVKGLLLGSLLLAPLPALTAPLNETELRERIVRFPKEADNYQLLAELLLENLRSDWAKQDPSLSGASFQAQTESFARRAKELLFLYNKVQELKPNQIEVLLQLAEVQYLFLGQAQESEKTLNQAATLAPDNPKVVMALADFTYYHKGKRADALDLLRKALSKQPSQADLLITLSDLLSTPPLDPNKDYEEAKTLLNQALEKSPQAHNLRLMLGRVWGRQATRDELKIDKLGLAIALKLFENVTQSDPQNQTAWIEQARAQQELGQFAEAEQSLRQLLSFSPRDPQARLMLGDILLIEASQALDQGKFSPQAAEAESWYLKLEQEGQLQELAPNQRVQLFYNQGLLARVQAAELAATPSQKAEAEKRFREAIAAYEKVQTIFDQMSIFNNALQKELGKAYYGLGLLLQGQERAAEGIAILQTACSLKNQESCDWLKKHGHGQ
ncbi:hypothetical protein COW36_17265 [bacterium (Candidatus Blackallbacteria) CG17_big_fil_post_rev_8_21_14_2_50_48_46]|uniref:Tetratricopeptide repeat-like domain-containing protein n=1 Tax=bacterium (Candidatus Blackallbacteria) CG17_big_fil_post_rev_8_21_14_2_50_48_46 TaxID=2014261 RepID=A0A2M7G0M9_9BACT|nr:MAG: hypothetical protein COW64_01465 [bacterium (Candidatus Blackallbacteria) CG18_big_fil_WC_8_21_14_2_50_49_26]PIW15173.1 MAG: hypothetical protein COW36_17265 [bacterium (Candidatus Blackallbacteria) CG17_big_fil_post_rev_8_21_14_2_50_48_46]PIW50150.1 MAG: hypothetical protein COW20_03505 [bacterium (Candidatus Blackallbacteria) CG13_big_fil_rev_8_21_14_2_50_49_14]